MTKETEEHCLPDFFLRTNRIGFRHWRADDQGLAYMLWGDSEVTRFISKPGGFSKEEVQSRLLLEVDNQHQYGVQYWPLFILNTGDFLGCCGFRPFHQEANTLELGFHLMKEQWGQGYASEAASAAIQYAASNLLSAHIVAGHHPENTSSCKVLERLGFSHIGDNYYEPTGLYHPSYRLTIMQDSN